MVSQFQRISRIRYKFSFFIIEWKFNVIEQRTTVFFFLLLWMDLKTNKGSQLLFFNYRLCWEETNGNERHDILDIETKSWLVDYKIKIMRHFVYCFWANAVFFSSCFSLSDCIIRKFQVYTLNILYFRLI